MQPPSLVTTPFGRLYSQRNSEGKLIAEFRPGSMSTTTRFSIDRDDFYFRRLSKYENRSTSVFSTVYASYIFLFISVLFSVTIVVAVGFLLHSYSPRATNSMHTHVRMHEKSSEVPTHTTTSTVQDYVGAKSSLPSDIASPIHVHLSTDGLQVDQCAVLRTMPPSVKHNAPTTASGQPARSKPSTRQGLPIIAHGDCPDKARIHWKKTAIRTLGIPRLPLIVEEEHRRHTAARIEEEERKARNEYEKIVLHLPRVHASYADSTDYFSEFLQGNKIRDAETAELEQFLRFCEVHGDFEKRRKLYYALCARQLLKQKQIDLLIADTKSYEAASELADKLLSHGTVTETSDSSSTSQTIFDELVKSFAEKSFTLCSLKSQGLHMKAKRCADMR